MSDNKDDNNNEQSGKIDLNSPEFKAAVEAAAKEAIDSAKAEFKEKLDGAYKQRDDALEKIAETERKKNEEVRKKLEEEGKHQEAAQMRIAELEAENKSLANANTRLTRDSSLSDKLSALKFRNSKARKMAMGEIAEELVKNEDGNWVGKDGSSLEKVVESYAANEDHSFMFVKEKTSGANINGDDSKDEQKETKKEPESIFEKSQDDVLAEIRKELDN